MNTIVTRLTVIGTRAGSHFAHVCYIWKTVTHDADRMLLALDRGRALIRTGTGDDHAVRPHCPAPHTLLVVQGAAAKRGIAHIGSRAFDRDARIALAFRVIAAADERGTFIVPGSGDEGARAPAARVVLGGFDE